MFSTMVTQNYTMREIVSLIYIYIIHVFQKPVMLDLVEIYSYS